MDQAGGKPEPLTKRREGMTFAPEWSAEGTHLAFSDKDGKSPFPPQSDEVTVEEKKAEGEGKAEEKKPGAAGKAADEKAEAKDKDEKKATPFRVDFEGLGSRVTRAPIEGDNIRGFAVGKGYLVYTVAGAPFYGRDSYAKPALKLYSLKDRKESTRPSGRRTR